MKSEQDLVMCFRSHLRKEFFLRSQRNSIYSHRAFSRDAGISPSYLSQILGGQRNLNEDKGMEVAKNLGWDRKKTDQFLLSIRFEASASETVKSRIVEEYQLKYPDFEDYFDLYPSDSDLISDWHHLAIVELSQTTDFEAHPQWIARRLGITDSKAKDSLQLLQKRGVLKWQGHQLVKTRHSVNFCKASIQSLRSFHRQHLEKAEESIDAVQPHMRSLTGTTLSISKDHLPKVTELINKFHVELMKMISDGEGTNSEVYHVAIQSYPLTKSPHFSKKLRSH